MSNQATNRKITRAVIRQPRYLEDFGRVEADVILYVASTDNKESRIRVITSVLKRKDEAFTSLYLRLTQDAARLWRLLEQQGIPARPSGLAA